MRTTLRLNDRTFAEAKKLAAETGRTFTAVVEDALREVLSRHKKQRKSRPIRLIQDGQGGLQPGVDLDHSASLLEVMDSRDDAD